MKFKSFNTLLLILSILSLVGLSITIATYYNQDIRRLVDMDTSPDVRPVDNEIYENKCAACHYAYQPGLLPSDSWLLLTSTNSLLNHFGQQIKIDEVSRIALINYLKENSAENASDKYRRSAKIASSVAENKIPIRISEIPYIVKRHSKLAEKYNKLGIKLKLSNCIECHVNAKQGDYNEITAILPSWLQEE